jgi:hypothetical protein
VRPGLARLSVGPGDFNQVTRLETNFRSCSQGHESLQSLVLLRHLVQRLAVGVEGGCLHVHSSANGPLHAAAKPCGFYTPGLHFLDTTFDSLPFPRRESPSSQPCRSFPSVVVLRVHTAKFLAGVLAIGMLWGNPTQNTGRSGCGYCLSSPHCV